MIDKDYTPRFTINSDTCGKVTAYTDSFIQILHGAPEHIILPDGLTEVRAALTLFEGASTLRYIYIPDSVTKIRRWALHYCLGLTKIDGGLGVTEIQNDAISETPVERLYFPECAIVGGNAFFKCGAEEIILPKLTSVGDFAFAYCDNLKSIYLPETVTTISANAFFGTACTINCGFSADSPAAANAPWGGTGQINYDM